MNEYLGALALTCAIELPLYAAVLGRGFGVPLRRVLGWAPAVNLITHPPLWFGARAALDAGVPYAVVFLVGESLVCLVEAGVLAWVLRREVGAAAVTLVAVGANACSAGAGLLLALLSRILLG